MMEGDSLPTQGVALDAANDELTSGSNKKMKTYKDFINESKQELTFKKALDVYNRSDADKEVDKLGAKIAGVPVDQYVNSPNDKKEDAAVAHNLVHLSKNPKDDKK